MTYLLHVVVMIGIYVVLGLSLNFVVGYGGMLSLCHAAFYGIGAYIHALLMVSAGWPFPAALAASAVTTFLLAFAVGAISLKLRGDLFVVATLGFQTIAFTILYNWTAVTNGSYGLTGMAAPRILGPDVGEPYISLVLVAIAATAAWWLLRRLGTLPFGRTLQAIRDDEIAAQSLGKDTASFKRTAFAIGGGLAAIAGALYASYATYIDPNSFTLDECVFILCVVIIGGAGNVRGPIAGAVVLMLLPEALRFVGLPEAAAANLRQIVYGALLILMMRFRPQGIAGRYAFDR